MLHWTILNEVDVFQGMPSNVDYQEMTCEGRTLIIEPRGDGTATIVRLISPLATDYLRPEWQPGSLILQRPSITRN
jgi:YlzJ-like protein